MSLIQKINYATSLSAFGDNGVQRLNVYREDETRSVSENGNRPADSMHGLCRVHMWAVA
jgi:hypothetical protein